MSEYVIDTVSSILNRPIMLSHVLLRRLNMSTHSTVVHRDNQNLRPIALNLYWAIFDFLHSGYHLQLESAMIHLRIALEPCLLQRILGHIIEDTPKSHGTLPRPVGPQHLIAFCQEALKALLMGCIAVLWTSWISCRDGEPVTHHICLHFNPHSP